MRCVLTQILQTERREVHRIKGKKREKTVILRWESYRTKSRSQELAKVI